MTSAPSVSRIARMIDRPLVLVGLMGAGKSVIGQRVARRLGLPWVDSDHEIEAGAGLSISEIFEHYGEEVFRDGERRVIARLLDGVPKVIGTGGGAFMNEATRALILSKGLAIWLDADIPTLVSRVVGRTHRPLLVGRDPEQVLRALAATRNPVYAQAQIRVPSRPVSKDRMTQDVINGVAHYLDQHRNDRTKEKTSHAHDDQG